MQCTHVEHSCLAWCWSWVDARPTKALWCRFLQLSSEFIKTHISTDCYISIWYVNLHQQTQTTVFLFDFQHLLTCWNVLGESRREASRGVTSLGRRARDSRRGWDRLWPMIWSWGFTKVMIPSRHHSWFMLVQYPHFQETSIYICISSHKWIAIYVIHVLCIDVVYIYIWETYSIFTWGPLIHHQSIRKVFLVFILYIFIHIYTYLYLYIIYIYTYEYTEWLLVWNMCYFQPYFSGLKPVVWSCFLGVLGRSKLYLAGLEPGFPWAGGP